MSMYLNINVLIYYKILYQEMGMIEYTFLFYIIKSYK